VVRQLRHKTAALKKQKRIGIFFRPEKCRYPIGLGARAKGRREQGDTISAVKSPAGPQNEQKSIQP